MECSVCKKSCYEKPLYRNNPKGKKADWRCQDCLDPTAPPVDPETKKLTEAIQNGNKNQI